MKLNMSRADQTLRTLSPALPPPTSPHLVGLTWPTQCFAHLLGELTLACPLSFTSSTMRDTARQVSLGRPK